MKRLTDLMNVAPPLQAPDAERRRLLVAAAAGSASLAMAPWAAKARHLDLLDGHAATEDTLKTTVEIYDLMRESTLGALHQAPVVGGLLSYLGALFLPSKEESPEQMWRKYTDQRISETVFALVKADLEGLTDVARQYKNAIATQDRPRILAQCVSSNGDFSTLIPRFKLEAERIALLPLFTVAATLHLALLRDIALKGRSIGFSAESVADFKKELTQRIDSYTQHVDRVVEAAIEKVRRENPNDGSPAKRNLPLSAMLAEKARLQLEVIDIRDTWYAFDASRFPGEKQVWLLREIFSPIAGWWDLDSRSPDEIPDWKTPGTRINRIEAWVRAQWRTRWLSALALHYDQTSEVLQTGEIWGDHSQLDITPSFWFESAQTSFSAGVARMSLKDIHGKVHHFGREPEENEASVTYGYAKHGLRSIRSVGKGRSSGAATGAISGLVYGFSLEHPGPRRIQPEAEARVIPVIAPHLRDWVRSTAG